MKFFKWIFSSPYLLTKLLVVLVAIILISGRFVLAFDPHLNNGSSWLMYLLFYPYIFAQLAIGGFYAALTNPHAGNSFLWECSGSWISLCMVSFKGIAQFCVGLVVVTFFFESIYLVFKKLIRSNSK